MKLRMLLTICAGFLLAGSGMAAFPTNASTATVNIDNMAPDFGDFSWRWRGYEDQTATLTVTNDAGDISIGSYFGLFKMTKRAGGDVTAYITKNVSAVTMATATMTITETHEVLETIPDDVYQAEFLLIDAADTNNTRTVARGTIRVEESLFDDDDDTFSASTITNLVDYLTITAAAATYVELAGDTMTGDLNGGGNSLTNWDLYVNGVGITNVDHGTGLTGLGDDDHTIYLLADGSRDLGGTWGAGGNTISDLGHASGGISIKQLNLWSGLSASRAYIELHEPDDSTSPGDVVIDSEATGDIYLNDDVYLSSNDLYYVNHVYGRSDLTLTLQGGVSSAGAGQIALLLGGTGTASTTGGVAAVIGGLASAGGTGGDAYIRGGVVSGGTDGVVQLQDADGNLKLQVDADGTTANDTLDMGDNEISDVAYISGGATAKQLDLYAGASTAQGASISLHYHNDGANADDLDLQSGTGSAARIEFSTFGDANVDWYIQPDGTLDGHAGDGSTDSIISNVAAIYVNGSLYIRDTSSNTIATLSSTGIEYGTNSLSYDAATDVLTVGTISNVLYYGDGSGLTNLTAAGFPLTENGNLAGYSLTNGLFVGDGSGLTNITTSSTNVLKSGITNSGTLGFDWADSEVADTITATNYLLLSGGTMSGDIDLNGSALTNADEVLFLYGGSTFSGKIFAGPNLLKFYDFNTNAVFDILNDYILMYGNIDLNANTVSNGFFKGDGGSMTNYPADELTQGTDVAIWHMDALNGTNGVYYTRGGTNFWLLEE